MGVGGKKPEEQGKEEDGKGKRKREEINSKGREGTGRQERKEEEKWWRKERGMKGDENEERTSSLPCLALQTPEEPRALLC